MYGKPETRSSFFETAKEKFFDEYLDKLKEIIDVTKIDYLIVDHTEPDHAGSIGRLLEYSPQMENRSYRLRHWISERNCKS